MSGKIIVTGVGCCLVDLLFNNIHFDSKSILPYLSKKRGDGGLVPGQLVFKEEFEKFIGTGINEILYSITGGKTQNEVSIGGPSIVSLINVSQLVDQGFCEVRFCGRGGNDANGQ